MDSQILGVNHERSDVMHKGWLLFWTAFFIACGVGDANSGHYTIATFELIFGIGIGINLIIRYIKE
jgi:hypothetical protein